MHVFGGVRFLHLQQTSVTLPVMVCIFGVG